MQNVMVVFILSALNLKYPFWTNLVQKIKVVDSWTNSNMKNSIKTIIFFCFRPEVSSFLKVYSKKSKIACKNLERRLIRISTFWWRWSVFLFTFSIVTLLISQQCTRRDLQPVIFLVSQFKLWCMFFRSSHQRCCM